MLLLKQNGERRDKFFLECTAIFYIVQVGGRIEADKTVVVTEWRGDVGRFEFDGGDRTNRAVRAPYPISCRASSTSRWLSMNRRRLR
jgi:hypothetical protein